MILVIRQMVLDMRLQACFFIFRAVFGGGRTSGGSVRNIIIHITIASTGNATDFGDLTDSRYAASAVSNSLRAVFAGGETPYKNVMDFVVYSFNR